MVVEDFSFNASNFCLITFTTAFIMVPILMGSAFVLNALASAGLNVPDKVFFTVNRCATTLACFEATPPVKIVRASLWAAFASADSLVPKLSFIACLGSTDALASFNIKILIDVHIAIEVKAKSRGALA